MERKDLIAPEQYNIVDEMERFVTDEDRKALIWMDEAGNKKEVTYKALFQDVNRTGNVLKELGLKKGDAILVMVPRVVEAYHIYAAALKLGLVIIPGSEMLKTKDLQYRIDHGNVKSIISYHAFTAQFEDIENQDSLIKLAVGGAVDGWKDLGELKAAASAELETVETSREDIALMSYTSGTTGNPKGVVHTHGWGYAHLRTAAENWLSASKGDIVWATAAPGWQKWVWSPFLSVLGTGATGFVYMGRFDAKTYLSLLEDYKINVLCCTPTEYRLMAKVTDLGSYKLSALHSAVSAGEPLNREVIDVFQKNFNIIVRDGYGQTESTLLLGIMKGMEPRPGSMGKPTPGNEVVVIDEDGNRVKTGEVGDIALKLDSPALFKTYFREPERRQQAERNGYFVTGDQASIDEDGYFWFEGRSDDIIISSGYTIGPFEVEDALVKHPAVAECAVVASPDEIRGNIVKAFVILREGVDENDPNLVKELQTHVKNTTAPYKYPRKIEFVKDLPKTSSGKIRRVELRNQEKQNAN
ncbi:acyl-CoA synthetase MbcS [Terribacillus saccharophilus]|uniref:Acetyl-CoA synthetase n=1 Tax=Terribacillus saccharophilus TaxID=361277 RepID=A0A075LN68_9BACI|nr:MULTISPECIES: acyl--CoA ligase [Terribacillus]AIF65833.1 acyl--CoA ligase [Terribacillus goriensis]MCM3226223.1 acyl--CoA ligase [Terribacillus saccharophilus]MEC0282923.1 acyl--CoA ligase [Terribacillus saccharophilus]MEC0292124.1 acyl--CoA ligase [Terribacillus saccharophilus]SEO13195.1 acetyl-CoA synthetase [Terribacillus saccharophilus]